MNNSINIVILTLKSNIVIKTGHQYLKYIIDIIAAINQFVPFKIEIILKTSDVMLINLMHIDKI